LIFDNIKTLTNSRRVCFMVASPEFERGITEFNQRQFYACHDTLEAIWVDAPEADKRFYQGILQVAVGCYHLSNDNLRGAIILLGEAVRRLCDYQPDYEGINVEQLLEQAMALLKALQQLQPEQTSDFWQQLQKQSGATKKEYDADSLADLVASCQLPYINRVLN
jgi:predicted metal-dependent hydrolase